MNHHFLLKKFKLSYVNKNYLNWFKKPEKVKYILYNHYKSLSDLKKYITKQKKRGNIIYCIFLKKKHIGNIKFEKINLKKKTAFVGILIGEEKYRNLGIGSKAIVKACNEIYKKFKISNIKLSLDTKNKIAYNSYKKAGFIILKKDNKKIIMQRNHNLI